MLLAEAAGQGASILHLARDEGHMVALAEELAFFAPAIEIVTLPAWDTVPYDRVSPHPDVLARRLDALGRLAGEPVKAGRVVVSTVSAILQRLPTPTSVAEATFLLAPGQSVDGAALLSFLDRHGYGRAETVMEPGEYAVRGGLIDLFPPGTDEPFRLDFFGDRLETIRRFDPMSQTSTGTADQIILRPVSEVTLDPPSIERFRIGYRELFGTVTGTDPLYESISNGVKCPGLEHWLPLFHEGLDTLFAYLPEAALSLDHQTSEAVDARLALIGEYYQARKDQAGQGLRESDLLYNPVPPARLFLDRAEFDRALAARPSVIFSPYAAGPDAVDAGGHAGPDFAQARVTPGANLFEAVRDRIIALGAEGKRVAIAAATAGSRDRLAGLLLDHGVANLVPVDDWHAAVTGPRDRIPVLVLGLAHGFILGDWALISETDILGERLARLPKRRRRAEHFLPEVTGLSEGDLVVHVEHGIGRYDGLETLDVAGAPHDCLRLVYDGGDKLYVPVENIEVLTRYGSEDSGVALDRLGGAAWQARKAKLKKKIRDLAEQLIAVAAKRLVKSGEAVQPAEGLYDEFCARFPYAETDDQLAAIADTIADLASGRSMDRLICGDVGFGKTEVALRAAFAVALSGRQVAVVVPTTLLARQHYRVFSERFAGLPVRVEQISRLVPAARAAKIRKDLGEGKVEIVIGTHALLAKSIAFRDLGLLVIDEEQHFGVAHKERLKQMKANVHVLTLSATPIPRTLQMALSGVREMSLIATPPIDRLAVRTFVLPFDPVVVREALLRERFRGGQSFYVCPRVADIEKVAERLKVLVPELSLAVAHGQLAAGAIEDVMSAFGDGAYDILLATNIIESGLDMPRVNTIVIHRADLF
ncbi:MAG: DEAD/DEAH box helicase, partial [Rhodospirillales bacterium]|nr:DEAD/DEAH box helicase [Rhodospirillales bacterium]